MPDSQNDFIAGLNLIKENLREVAVQRAIEQATSMSEDIKASEKDQFEQRNQIRQVAQNLTSRLIGFGLPATSVQTAVSAFALQPLQTPEELIQQGTLRGGEQGQQEVQQGQTLARNLRQPAVEAAQAQLNMSFNQQKRLQTDAEILAAKKELLGMKNVPKIQNLSAIEVDKITKLDTTIDTGRKLLGDVDSNPNLVGLFKGQGPVAATRRLADPEFSAFYANLGRWFQEYRSRITGAAASEQELARLEKLFPSAGLPLPVFKARVESITQEGERIKNRYLSNLQKSGRNMGGFQAPIADMSGKIISSPGASKVTVTDFFE